MDPGCAPLLVFLAHPSNEITVRTENSILIDYMTESPNVSGDDRSAILPDAVRLAERPSLVLHPDGKEQGIFSSE